ncbi:ester cyclase [Terribacillus saccharophilus]|uniref:Polyketide cyclase n=1 Tax=Terribacillus saccharophilus TaxID=361277 RepID=A0A268AA93_9BACI|nr:ester cyclase [Terribacillus saccharophilus]PAD21041.1 polyketide cyclase [Terribacillus saccharophilus]PAF15893.1 polyketide cyclase [Terribacillus saccharophilus]
MTPEQVVRNFLEIVRSGKNPEFSNELMADSVMAHQVESEEEQTVQRTPQEYAEHVKEMIETYGNFSFEIQECISQGNKVYVRWKQEGEHQGNIGEYQSTGLPLVELASAVYRVEEEKIAEYWIQIDRLGINKQLERNASINF